MKKNQFTGKTRIKLAYYSMLTPFLIAFVLFMVIPMISAIILSLTDFNMLQWPHFVGFSNYTRIFTEDEIFMKALSNTLIMALIVGPVGYILSFITAWLINELNHAAKTIVTFMVYSPALAGNVYFIWKYIFSADERGFLNNLLMNLGITREPIAWLSDTRYMMGTVIIVSLWMSFGVGFLSFIAALKALDRSYYEAAAIDGLKNRWQELYYVTFPQLGPQLLFGAILSISSAFATGAVNNELTGFPSTNYTTHTILLHIIDYGSSRYEMGYASALAVILFAIMLLSWKFIQKLLSRFTA